MAKHAGAGGPVNVPGEPAPGADQRTPIGAPRHAAPPRSGLRRIVGVVVVALLVVVAIVVVSRLDPAAPERAEPEVQPTSEPSAPALSAPSLPASSLPASSLSGPATAGSDPASLTGPPPAPLPQTGPGVTEPGILLIAAPAADGSFDVLERIRPVSPVSGLTLRPAPVDQAGGQFASASAAATRVQVTAGDQPVVVPGATVAARVDLPVPAVDQIELRYRLAGVTVRSTPSTTGRALAVIGPLTGEVDGDFPVLIIISGGTVLGLNCPLLPFADQACGSRDRAGSGFERELPWRLALASVQFNVPGS